MKKSVLASFYILALALVSCGGGTDSSKEEDHSAPSQEMSTEESAPAEVDSSMATPEAESSGQDITVNEEGVK